MQSSATIRRARLEAGLTQRGLADRAGTSQATVSAYETGAKVPSVATLARLLAAAGSRLTVAPARTPVRVPTREEHERVARDLLDVLDLAEALPSRPRGALRFPPLRP